MWGWKSELWSCGVVEFWSFGVLEFWGCGVLGLWSFGVVGLWGCFDFFLQRYVELVALCYIIIFLCPPEK